MPSLPIELLGAVQDLCALYTRLGPRGPYRHSLFGEQAATAPDWPGSVRQSAARLDELIRGVSCLLANDLAAAAPPLLRTLWRAVRELAQQLAPAGWRRPAYYRFLTLEMEGLRAADTQAVYRLYGEVLAIYLDLLCACRPAQLSEYGPRVGQLRRQLIQTGVKSSTAPSAARSSDSPGSSVL